MTNSDINILLLEDDLELLEALAESLDDQGYRVTAVSDSQKAVDLTLDQEFDLVITDIRMAGMDGLDALARVRELQPEVRSLVVTGYSSEADTIRALRLGVGEYLNKPFRLEQFREAVERLAAQIRQHRSRDRLEHSLSQFMTWALENYAEKTGVDWVVKAGELSKELATRMDMGGEAIQLACLYDLLGADQLPVFVAETLPARSMAILKARQGLEQHVMEAARALAQGQELPQVAAPVREVAARVVSGDNGAAPSAAPGRRNTLSLALALEQSGQLEAAIKAYQALLVPPPTREAVLAAQALAWLAHRLGKAKQVRDYSLQAVTLSRHLGPLTTVAVAVDAGVLLASIGAPEALPTLQEAAQLAERLDFPQRSAQADLALSWLQGQDFPLRALEVLLQSAYQGELAESSWWLAPLLLERAAAGVGPEEHQVLSRALQRVLAEKSATVQQLIRSGRLSPAARRLLLEFPVDAVTLQLLAADSDPAVRQEASRRVSSESSEKNYPPLRIFSLGIQELFFGEQRLPDEVFKKNQKARYMLAYLAMERGRAVSEDVLVDLFWPDESAKGRKNLYSIRSIWRKSLQPAGLSEEIEAVIRTAAGLMINPDLPWWHDYEELRRSLDAAERLEKSQRSMEALAPLRRAAQLYRGPFLEGCYLDWAVSVREQTEYQMTQALLRLAALTLDQSLSGGQPGSEALEVCHRVLELDPCSQEAYRLGMQAFLEMGRPQDAVRLYERCVKALRREMQAEPSIPVVEMYHRARMAL